MFANVTASRGKHQRNFVKDPRKLCECAAKVQVLSLRPPNIPQAAYALVAGTKWVELCLILFGTIVAQMLQVTLSSCGNFQPSARVMLQDVCPYFVLP